MTTDTHLAALADMLDLVGKGELLAAFDKHYHDEVVMHDPLAGTVTGKAANREREEQFLSMIASVEAFEVGPLLGGGNQTAYENRFAFTTTEGQQVDLKQVAVQTWQDGKIVEEKFYPAAS